MKDIVIKERVVKRELILLLGMFVVAFLMNIYAIIVHGGNWSELVSQLHIVGLLTLFFYVLVLLVRLVWWGLSAVWMRVTKSKSRSTYSA
jgi:hypothetical protein